MSRLTRFLQAMGGDRSPRETDSAEKDVAMHVLDEASKDADRILDNALARALRETDRAIRRLRNHEAAG